MKHLAWKFFAPNGEAFRVARQHFTYDRPSFPHDHDYVEVFWIESGEGVHRINGLTLPLEPGDLVMIRPQDRHDLQALKPEGLRLVNVSFPEETVAFIKGRYFPTYKNFWGGTAPQPSRFKLSRQVTERIGLDSRALARAPRTRFHIERFILNLLALLKSSQAPARNAPEIPLWLSQACDEIQNPEHFSKGTPEFSRLAGRSSKHIARTTRALLNRTPGDIVNEARMFYAAEELAMTDKAIVDIAAACGIQSLAHFYSLFQSRYGLPPRRYRLRQHMIQA